MHCFKCMEYHGEHSSATAETLVCDHFSHKSKHIVPHGLLRRKLDPSQPNTLQQVMKVYVSYSCFNH